MGWKPTITDGGASGDEAPPPPPRRRRRTLPGEEAAPNLRRVTAESPRQAAERRPRGGVHTTLTGQPEDRVSLRMRLGKRWSEIVLAVKAGEYTWRQFAEGLSEEELLRCQLKDKDGRFMGRPPAFVPREFLLECQREQRRRFEEIFGSEVLGIAREYVKLCSDKEIPGKDRAKLMQYAMERIFGGIPKEVKLTQEQPWESVFVNVTEDGAGDMPAHLAERYARYQERDANPDASPE